MTYLVAGDKANIQLSRTTRSDFLKLLIVKLKVEKQRFAFDELLRLAKDFAIEHDYDIKSREFVNSFFGYNILHISNDQVAFTLPFVETYLLASELCNNETLARTYFNLEDDEFDISTFDLYAEIRPSECLVSRIIDHSEKTSDNFSYENTDSHVLLTNDIRPALLANPSRLEAIQIGLRQAVKEVQKNKDDSEDKQRILDIADRAREKAAERTLKKNVVDQNNPFYELNNILKVWIIASILLGSGNERLNASSKRKLSALLVKLASIIVNMWTKIYKDIDFAEIKQDLASADVGKYFSNSENEREKITVNRLIGSLVDVLEFQLMSDPIRRVLYHLCENARSKVLGLSIQNAETSTTMEGMIQAAWLADIDSGRGTENLSNKIASLPPAPFFRTALSTHFIMRVYWSHATQKDIDCLLDAAEKIIRGTSFGFDKGKMRRELDKATGRFIEDE